MLSRRDPSFSCSKTRARRPLQTNACSWTLGCCMRSSASRSLKYCAAPAAVTTCLDGEGSAAGLVRQARVEVDRAEAAMNRFHALCVPGVACDGIDGSLADDDGRGDSGGRRRHSQLAALLSNQAAQPGAGRELPASGSHALFDADLTRARAWG